MEPYSDKQVIDGIAKKDQNIIKFVYDNYYVMIKRMIINRGGNPDTVKDIFQEAMLIVYSKAREDKLVLTCSFSTYLYAICRNLWFHELRQRKESHMKSSHPDVVAEDPGEDSEVRAEIKKIFDYHYNRLSKDCKDILDLHFKKKSLTDICRILGYSNEHNAADHKYRCKKSLFKRIMDDPRYKKLINELY